MIEKGVPTAADLGSAIVRSYRHSVDPLRLSDRVGLRRQLVIE